MATGKVKWFNNSKGFGFIKADDGTDVFVHHSSILPEGAGISDGDSVTFDIVQDTKGPKAVNVQKA